jgi:hypothetical protein
MKTSGLGPRGRLAPSMPAVLCAVCGDLGHRFYALGDGSTICRGCVRYFLLAACHPAQLSSGERGGLADLHSETVELVMPATDGCTYWRRRA